MLSKRSSDYTTPGFFSWSRDLPGGYSKLSWPGAKESEQVCEPDHFGSTKESCSIVEEKALGITPCWPMLTMVAIEEDAPICTSAEVRDENKSFCYQSPNKSWCGVYLVVLSFVRPGEKAELSPSFLCLRRLWPCGSLDNMFSHVLNSSLQNIRKRKSQWTNSVTNGR
jgi:hypothetical protein